MNWIKQKEMLNRAILARRLKIYNYLKSNRYQKRFKPKHIHDSVYSYIGLGGKSLRPIVLLFSCGAVGGNEEKAMPAAAAIEAFHTWTLVHDDIIDKDDKRRGGSTVHEEFRRRAIEEFEYDKDYAKHYGTAIAMLAGDTQHGWAICLLSELYTKSDIEPSVVLYLINELETYVLDTLVEGETLDVQYSKLPIESMTEDMIIDMLWKKTGVLYEFAGRAGAMIGLNKADPKNKLVKEISQFTNKCGIAFQLQDDILGLLGSEEKLGKPVGSDIREGKQTTIVYYALKHANDVQKKQLLSVLGNERASREEIQRTTDLLWALGGIDHTKDIAKNIIEKEAMNHLKAIPESKYKRLLSAWAEYMINLEF